MVTEVSVLVALVMLVARIPMPPSVKRRGQPKTYSDRLFLKALVIMVVRDLPRVHSFLPSWRSQPPRCSVFVPCSSRMAATRLGAPSNGV